MIKISKILFLAENGITDTIAFDLRRALALAARHQAELVLATTLDSTGPLSGRRRDRSMLADRKEQLQSLLSAATPDARNIRTRVLTGAPPSSIVRDVERHGYDLVIKTGTAPATRSETILNRALLNECPCPVWITRSESGANPRVVLVALEWKPDDREHEQFCRQLMAAGISLAISSFAELHVVHAWQLEHGPLSAAARHGPVEDLGDGAVRAEPAQRKAWLTKFMYRSCTELSDETFLLLRPRSHLIHGPAAEAVSGCARDVDAGVVVMGSGPINVMTAPLGANTAEEIFDRIECGALAIRRDEYDAPASVRARGKAITQQTRASA